MPFDRCYGCRLVWPEAELEGGLCGPCRGLGAGASCAAADLPIEVAEATMERDASPFPESELGPLFGGRS